MLKWEYALLVRRRQAATNDIGWEVVFVWYGPDGSMVDVTPYGDTALAHLNRAGDQGWELGGEEPLPGNNELHRYHLKRTKPPALPGSGSAVVGGAPPPSRPTPCRPRRTRPGAVDPAPAAVRDRSTGRTPSRSTCRRWRGGRTCPGDAQPQFQGRHTAPLPAHPDGAGEGAAADGEPSITEVCRRGFTSLGSFAPSSAGSSARVPATTGGGPGSRRWSGCPAAWSGCGPARWFRPEGRAFWRSLPRPDLPRLAWQVVTEEFS
jgi:hypothetical protein